MYTIRPRSAGVIGFDPPHDDSVIAIIAAVTDLVKGPKSMCTIS